MNAVRAAAVLLLMLNPGAYAPGSPAADPYSIKAVDAAAPTELAEPVRTLLAGRCVQFFAGGDRPLAEVWFRKEAPGDAVEVQIMNGLTYREIPETTVLGALRVNGDFTDYRHQKIAPGVYTMRLGFQPVTDDHQGTTPYPEFLLLCPAAEDVKPEPMEHKALEELSGKTTGKHPAVLPAVPRQEHVRRAEIGAKGRRLLGGHGQAGRARRRQNDRDGRRPDADRHVAEGAG